MCLSFSHQCTAINKAAVLEEEEGKKRWKVFLPAQWKVKKMWRLLQTWNTVVLWGIAVCRWARSVSTAIPRGCQTHQNSTMCCGVCSMYKKLWTYTPDLFFPYSWPQIVERNLEESGCQPSVKWISTSWKQMMSLCSPGWPRGEFTGHWEEFLCLNCPALRKKHIVGVKIKCHCWRVGRMHCFHRGFCAKNTYVIILNH